MVPPCQKTPLHFAKYAAEVLGHIKIYKHATLDVSCRKSRSRKPGSFIKKTAKSPSSQRTKSKCVGISGDIAHALSEFDPAWLIHEIRSQGRRVRREQQATKNIQTRLEIQSAVEAHEFKPSILKPCVLRVSARVNNSGWNQID